MCGELNPGPLPCEGSVIPLHHTPEGTDMECNFGIKPGQKQSTINWTNIDDKTVKFHDNFELIFSDILKNKMLL